MQPGTWPGRVRAVELPLVNCPRQSGPTIGEGARTAERRFLDSPHVALRSILCEFHEGVLVLRGHVPSFYLKQLAQEMVRTVEGVERILNVVEVKRPADSASTGSAAGSA
jgi:osmotically-inducible protein OsmY